MSRSATLRPAAAAVPCRQSISCWTSAQSRWCSTDGNGKETVTQSDSVCVKVPMAVIVNGNTYSAAEFFAAALQEYDWATIVGQNTTGKGRSQTTIALPDGSAVHISSRKYLTPNRVDLSEQGGLVPDVVVAPAADSDVDAQLEAAIAALR